MPRLSASKEQVTGQQELFPAGTYTIQLKGFNPRVSEKGDSINLNPDLRIVNSPLYNDKRLFDSLNTNAPFIWHELCHCLGVPLEEDGDGEMSIPGEFQGVDFETALKVGPKKKVQWTYNGPLLNQQGDVLVEQVTRTYKGKTSTRNEIKQYLCRVDGCDVKHSDNLIRE